MYDEDYKEKPFDTLNSREEAKKALIQLRSSNILIGSNPNDYTTVHNENYIRHPLVPQHEQIGPGFDLKATNLNFGKDSIDYLSSKQDDYGWKQPDFQDQNKAKDLAKDLRAHHFDLGTCPPTLKSECAEQFVQKEPDIVDKSKFQDPFKNSLTVRHHPYNEHNPYVSEYKDQVNRDLTPVETAPAGVNENKDTKGLYDSVIKFGDGKWTTNISEAHDKFVPKDMSARGKVNNHLLKGNLNFGNYAPDYSTTYNTDHTNKGVLPKDNKSQQIMQDLRSNHYELGYQGVRLKKF